MTATNNGVTFQQFKAAVKAQFNAMEATGLYVVGVDKDIIWDTYLDSFPEGTNKMYKERREYDCTCCKQFIRTVGGLVTIKNNKKVSIWDIQVGGYYQPVIDALAALVHAAPVADKFYHFESKVGTDRSVQVLKDTQKAITWDHFHVELPRSAVMASSDIATKRGLVRTNKETLFRSLDEIELDAAQTILELIGQNSIYRGKEYKSLLETFVSLKKAFDKAEDKDLFCWVESAKLGGVSNIRGTAIGTLLVDLSAGEELESSVLSFEAKMNPVNYKRPTALVSKRQIEQAQQTIQDLGMMESLGRRYAVAEDLTINNVLFADRSAKKAMNVFDELISAASTANPKVLAKVEEVSIADFLNNIVPTATSMEVLMENRLTNKLVSLIAPVTASAPGLFKWKSGFSWSYNGEVTDSIKERVKAAGGKVEGELRVSLSWHNGDDLDLHMYEPSGDHLYFGNRTRQSRNGGQLDVDMNAGGPTNPVDPVENIIYQKGRSLAKGKYRVVVNNFAKRDNTNPQGFEVEIEYKGELYNFAQKTNPANRGNCEVIEFDIDAAGKLNVVKSISHTKASKEVWGVTTEQFQKVSLLLNSPNHWDGEETGNKHVFFILEGCKNPDQIRGFYNEYLKDELARDHRKVFEILGSKMRVEASDNQLSGLGFSSTDRAEVYVKVEGAFTRTVKVVF